MGDDQDGADASDDRPKIFRNINGWIGGITGTVIAVAGLYSAVHEYWPHNSVQAVAQVPADADANAAADTEPTADSATKATTEAPAEELPLAYKAVDATLEKTGRMWVYTDADGVTRYQEVSRDDGQTIAFDPMRKVYARWPNGGGMVEESTDNQAHWSDSFSIWVPAPTRPRNKRKGPPPSGRPSLLLHSIKVPL
jgi:hypothetical protein